MDLEELTELVLVFTVVLLIFSTFAFAYTGINVFLYIGAAGLIFSTAYFMTLSNKIEKVEDEKED